MEGSDIEISTRYGIPLKQNSESQSEESEARRPALDVAIQRGLQTKGV